jgi:NADPH-dependent 7-cyano-7-deazaguanine reductase QueF-like protein
VPFEYNVLCAISRLSSRKNRNKTHIYLTLSMKKLWFSYELACKQMFRPYVICKYRCLDCTSLVGTDVWTTYNL